MRFTGGGAHEVIQGAYQVREDVLGDDGHILEGTDVGVNTGQVEGALIRQRGGGRSEGIILESKYDSDARR